MIGNLLRYLRRSSKKSVDPFSRARGFMLNPAPFKTTAVFDPATGAWWEYR